MASRLAWLGMGGNVGDVRSTLVGALRVLDSQGDIEVLRVSGLYRTPPWGKTDQPPFLNACAEILTSKPPRHLLEACLNAELDFNRVRSEKWGPRTIDIDIIAVDGIAIADDGLAIPHNHAHERGFVLVPLADLVPQLQINGRPVADWKSRADVSQIVKVGEPARWDRANPPWRGAAGGSS